VLAWIDLVIVIQLREIFQISTEGLGFKVFNNDFFECDSAKFSLIYFVSVFLVSKAKNDPNRTKSVRFEPVLDSGRVILTRNSIFRFD